MRHPLTPPDFPRFPVGSDDGVFRQAAARDAAPDSGRDPTIGPSIRERRVPLLESLQKRLLKRPHEPVRVGRYDVIRCIGVGGMGVVYEALTVEGRRRVALKTLRLVNPAALYRFKREFRAMQGFYHPNLVRLHELASIRGEWFVTMEHVDGIGFLDYVRPHPDAPSMGQTLERIDVHRPTTTDASTREGSIDEPPLQLGVRRGPLDEGRLRAAMRQLAGGVHALHGAGIVHRDLNPTNVLVGDGRLVVLDFGLVRGRERPFCDASSFDGVSGTPGYMSPEQAAGKPAGPESDWYGVGVMLFEAITGRLPFAGRPHQMLVAKQQHDAPDPGELVPGVPRDLRALSVALLRRAPHERPSGADVLRCIAGGELVVRPARAPARDAAPASSRRPRARGPALVGREEHLAALAGALAAVRPGRPIAAHVHGDPGTGKTVLCERFLCDLEGDALVLEGRCLAGESAPYKAIDALVDSLSHHLRRLHDADVRALFPPDLADLARLFPVVKSVGAISAALAPDAAAAEPCDAERGAIRALKEILAKIAADRPLVLFVEDLDASDPAGAGLLGELVSQPSPPGVLLLVTSRGDASSAPAREALRSTRREPIERVDVALGPLDPAPAAELALACLGRDDEPAREIGRAHV